jgi:hypothetical protein
MADVREWTLHDVPERVRGHATVVATISGPTVRHGSMETALSKRDVERLLYDAQIEELPFANPDRRTGWEAACGFIAGRLGIDLDGEAAS